MPPSKGTVFAVYMAILSFFPFVIHAASTEGPLIAGVGVGVFAIILGAVFAFVICLIAQATPHALLISFLATLIPIILFLVFYFAPTTSSLSQNIRQQTNTTDSSFGWRVAFFVLIILGFVISILFFFTEFCTNIIRAPRIDSQAFFNLKEMTEAAQRREEAVEQLLESPDKSFEMQRNSARGGPQDSVTSRTMPPIMPQDDGLTRPRRRIIGDTMTSQMLPELEDNRSLVRRRIE